MDLSSGQLQEEKKIAEPIQKTEGELAKEQWQEAMRQYQPIMNDEEYRRVVAQQAEVARDSWQEYLNRTVLKAEDLRTEQPVQQTKPKYRASILDEPVPEQTLSEKEQEKRLRRLKRTNQYADTSTVLMQEEASKVQEQLAQENTNKTRLEEELAGPKSREVKNKMLDNRLEEMLHSSFYAEILAGDQMEQRYGQLLVRDKQMMNFVDVLNQSREYMESKTEVERERIQHFTELAQTFHSVLSALSRLKGLGFDGQGSPQNDAEYQQAQMDYATNLKELIQKSQSSRIRELDTRVIEEKVEALYQRNEHGYIDERGHAEVGYAEMREKVKQDFDWLNVEHISDFYQVEELIKLHEKIEANPEAYQKNKEVIDSIMKDMIQQAEVLGICASKAKTTATLELEYANPRTKEMGQVVARVNAAYKRDYLNMLERMKSMIEAVKIVLGVRKAKSIMTLQYLEEKQYMMPEQEQLKENLAYEACYFADMMKEKNAVYQQTGREKGGFAASDSVLVGTNARKAVLIRGRKMNPDGTQVEPDADWNLQVIRLAEMDAIAAKKKQVTLNEEMKANLTEEDKARIEQYDVMEHYTQARNIVQSEMDKVLNFDMARLYSATPEDLLKMQRELQEINLPQMTASDIGKMDYPEQLKQEKQRQKADLKARIAAMTVTQKQCLADLDALKLEEEELKEQEQNLERSEQIARENPSYVTPESTASLNEWKRELAEKRANLVARRTPIETTRNQLGRELGQLGEELERFLIPTNLKQDILGRRLEEYASRSEVIRLYADMARGYAMQEAAKQGVLTKDAMTEVEQQKLKIIDVEDRKKVVDEMKIYADEKLITQREQMKPGAWDRMLHSKEIMPGVIAVVCRKEEEQPKTIRYMQRFFRNPEMSEHDRKMDAWLSTNRYKFAGTSEDMINEAIFRTYSSMMNYQSLNATSDEEVDLMLEQLAAGAFLTKDSTEEEIKAAQATNIEGLKTYVKILKKQYSYTMKKYGMGLDSIEGEDVLMHYQEFERDFSNIQVDHNIVTHLPEGILDMNNEEDRLFYNQIEYYNSMGAMYNVIRSAIEFAIETNQELDYKAAIESYRGMVGQLPSTIGAREYLKGIRGIAPVIDWKQPYEE